MEIVIAAEKIFNIGAFPVTNTMLVTWFATLLLSALAFFATRKVQMIPSGLQNIMEFVVEPEECVYPMVPAGAPITNMLLV